MSPIVALARIVRAAAPTETSDKAIRLAVIKWLSWINRNNPDFFLVDHPRRV